MAQNHLLPRSDTGKLESDVASITASAAWRWLQSDAVIHLIDIRSTQEFLFVGHPVGAAHVPYIDEPDWIPNPCFTNQVRALLPVVVEMGVKREDPILLICRSGERSKAAGEVLLEDGVNNVFSIIDGFEGPLDKHDHRSGISGWRYDGLPWAQC